MLSHWIGVVSRDHVRAAVRGNFVQLGHGRLAPVRRLAKGDWVVFYSPRTSREDGASLRMFTALGRITDETPQQVRQTDDFHPYRRCAQFEEAREIPIDTLVDRLSFTDGPNWGMRLRRGVFAISDDDFSIIDRAMRTEPSDQRS